MTARHYSNSQNSIISFDFRWFLAKNLSNFVFLPWKLHNQYCHMIKHTQIMLAQPKKLKLTIRSNSSFVGNFIYTKLLHSFASTGGGRVDPLICEDNSEPKMATNIAMLWKYILFFSEFNCIGIFKAAQGKSIYPPKMRKAPQSLPVIWKNAKVFSKLFKANPESPF